MVQENLRPSDIMTRAAFENAIVAATAIGAAATARSHIIAIARHMGVELTIEDWQRVGPTSRCWSTCSRPGASSARPSTAPAACRR